MKMEAPMWDNGSRHNFPKHRSLQHEEHHGIPSCRCILALRQVVGVERSQVMIIKETLFWCCSKLDGCLLVLQSGWMNKSETLFWEWWLISPQENLPA